MIKKESKSSVSGMIMSLLVLFNIIILKEAYIGNAALYGWLALSLPLLVLALYDVLQQKKAILRNLSITGHLRYFPKTILPALRQHFPAADLDGKRLNRRPRSKMYQRAREKKLT